MPEPRKLRVFLCHASQDHPTVNQLYQKLLAEGWMDIWMAEESIYPGQQWRDEIEKALESSDVVIVALSKNSANEEGYTQQEINFSLSIAREKPQNTIFIIPIRLDNCDVPRYMRSWDYVDFCPPEERERAYRRLLRSLEMKAQAISIHTEQQSPAHFIHSPQDFHQISDLATSTFGTFRFAKITKGKFIMGSKVSNQAAWDNELPQRPYAIGYDYWISWVPITNEQFGEYAVSTRQLGLLPTGWRKCLDYPVVGISWYEAVDYTKWLNKVFKNEISREFMFRLPTEAEWERASRGDSGQEFPWGNDRLDDLMARKDADYFRSTSEFESKKALIKQLQQTLELAPVGYFSPFTDSPHKVADMMGSILEWTQSLSWPYPYEVQDGREDLDTKGERVIRGCFTDRSERFSVRSARRGSQLPERKDAILGFRIVVAPPTTI